MKQQREVDAFVDMQGMQMRIHAIVHKLLSWLQEIQAPAPLLCCYLPSLPGTDIHPRQDLGSFACTYLPHNYFISKVYFTDLLRKSKGVVFASG